MVRPTGSKNRACDRERERERVDHGKRKWRVHTGTHRNEQRRQGRNNSNSGEVQEPTKEDETSKGWTDHLIGNFTSVWKQDTRIQKFEEDGTVNGMRLCDYVTKVYWKFFSHAPRWALLVIG